MPTLDSALAANRRAVASFLAAARAVPANLWTQPTAPGKWSPAQLTDHVAVSYEVALRALKGDKTIGSIPGFLRPIVRAFAYTNVLKKGAFPTRMKGPPSFAPSTAHPPYDASTARMEAAVAALESHTRAMAQAGTHTFVHPAFGQLTVVDYVRYSELHAVHHQAQFPAR